MAGRSDGFVVRHGERLVFLSCAKRPNHRPGDSRRRFAQLPGSPGNYDTVTFFAIP